MSWLFGKKKTKDTSSEGGEGVSTSQVDDYIYIEKDMNSSSTASERDHNAMFKSFVLYPPLGPDNDVNLPKMSERLIHQNILCDPQAYLHGIKLELNKKLEDNFEIDRLQADEILSFVLRIKSDDYDYDFSLENSVVNEMAISAQ
uniref:UMA domain-containing protein n=1 Tax=Bracon brevicornis TaxID=1563983 RepID=A0A6V7LP21_9HYME